MIFEQNYQMFLKNVMNFMRLNRNYQRWKENFVPLTFLESNCIVSCVFKKILNYHHVNDLKKNHYRNVHMKMFHVKKKRKKCRMGNVSEQ